jgi:hypothetical protein
MANENALDIDLLDTLFFQPDHSIYYVYKVLLILDRMFEKV